MPTIPQSAIPSNMRREPYAGRPDAGIESTKSGCDVLKSNSYLNGSQSFPTCRLVSLTIPKTRGIPSFPRTPLDRLRTPRAMRQFVSQQITSARNCTSPAGWVIRYEWEHYARGCHVPEDAMCPRMPCARGYRPHHILHKPERIFTKKWTVTTHAFMARTVLLKNPSNKIIFLPD